MASTYPMRAVAAVPPRQREVPAPGEAERIEQLRDLGYLDSEGRESR